MHKGPRVKQEKMGEGERKARSAAQAWPCDIRPEAGRPIVGTSMGRTGADLPATHSYNNGNFSSAEEWVLKNKERPQSVAEAAIVLSEYE